MGDSEGNEVVCGVVELGGVWGGQIETLAGHRPHSATVSSQLVVGNRAVTGIAEADVACCIHSVGCL